MKITAKPNLDQLASVEITASITMSLAKWESIAEALKNGKQGYFGSPHDLLEHINRTIQIYKSTIETNDLKKSP